MSKIPIVPERPQRKTWNARASQLANRQLIGV
jgi:hypothetical protein